MSLVQLCPIPIRDHLACMKGEGANNRSLMPCEGVTLPLSFLFFPPAVLWHHSFGEHDGKKMHDSGTFAI